MSGHVRGELVSIVIACFNQGRFLADAIESALAQSHRHVEAIVVDDGSTDGTADVCARYPRVRYVRQENQGPNAARNTGLRHSRGRHLVFLDADDRLLPDAVSIGLAVLRAHAHWQVAIGRCALVWPDRKELQPEQPDVRDHYSSLLRSNYIWTPAVAMFSREALDVLGGWDTTLRLSNADDYEMFLRVARQLPLGCHSALVAEYRQHEAGKSRHAARMLAANDRIFAREHPYTRGDAERERSWQEGRRSYRAHYGTLLAKQVSRDRRAGRYRDAMGGIFTLLRYYPRAVPRVVFPRSAGAFIGLMEAAAGAARTTRRWMTGQSTGTLEATPNPIPVHGSPLGATELTWRASGTESLEVHAGRPDGPLVGRSGSEGRLRTAASVQDGTRFFLQDVSDGRPLTREHTLAVVKVRLLDAAAFDEGAENRPTA